MYSPDFSVASVNLGGVLRKAQQLTYSTGVDFEDNLQDLFLEVLEIQAAKPEVAARGGGYLLQAAVWQLQHKRAQQQRREPACLQLEEQTWYEVPANSDEEASPLLAAVNAVAAELGYTDMLILLGFGLKKSEVAAAMGISGAAVSQRLARLRQRVIEKLAEEA